MTDPNPLTSGDTVGLVPKPDAPVSFEPCDDSCSDEWWATEGHHEDTPALRKTFMRQSAHHAGTLGSADRARSAKVVHGFLGRAPGVYDHVACEENGSLCIVVYDDEDNEITTATAWWPATWMVVPDA